MAGQGSRGKRSGGPWYGDERRVVLFERATRSIRGLRRATRCGSRTYNLMVDVAHYEKRRLSITFSAGSSRPKIMVDGPTDSPHRYEDGSLCIWCPWDSEEQRWTLQDGLLQLLGLISLHLFREAWWRETGEWLGPEAPHSAKAN